MFLRGKHCSYHQTQKCRSSSLWPLQELCGFILKSPAVHFYGLLVPLVTMWNARHFSICFFWVGGLSWFLVLALHSSVFSQKNFSLHADGGNVLQRRKCFLNTWVLSVLHLSRWLKTLDTGIRYFQRGNYFTYFSFSGNALYLELQAENCLPWIVQTLILSFFSS